MANAPFQRAPGKGKFAYTGVNLRTPPDLTPQGRAPFLLNVSPDQRLGALNARAGLTRAGAIGGNLHSCRMLNDTIPGEAASGLFVGSGANLFYGSSSFTQADEGYSGNPLSLVPYRPPQSPESWLYVYDSTKQTKYKNDGTARNIGIMPPVNEPFIQLAEPPNFSPILDVSSVSGWDYSGVAAAPTSQARLSGTTIGVILYDTNSGWATIQPANGAANYSGINAGMRISLGSVGETQVVQQVFPALPSTTVSGIAYDSGTTGMCTVAPSIAYQGLMRNALINIGGNNTIVISVTQGPDGLYSFRCNLSAAVSAGAAIDVPVSFRIYLSLTHTAGESLTSLAAQSVMTVSGDSTGGNVTGQISTALSVNMLQIDGRPVMADDYVHVSFYVDQPLNVQEVHFLFDVDPTTNNFTENFYYFVARQGDFEQNSIGQTTTITSRLNAIQNDIANSLPITISDTMQAAQLPYPAADIAQSGAPGADQFQTGAGQWYEALFTINDLMRVGSDESSTLANLKAFGLLAILTGSATIQVGGVWVGGTFGPDVNMNSFGNQGQPIIYRYRYRSSETGAVSDVSPAARGGVLPWRQAVKVTPAASPDPQVDLIDIERNGGTGDTWHQCMTVPNTSNGVIDTVLETVAQAGDPLALLQYAPWPITDKVRTGTCNAVGTTLTWVSGDTFNPNWIRGEEIILNNQTYTLHAPPASATQLQLEESAGVLTAVTFIIPEATIIGFPLPYACLGPNGTIFATGDPYNPGLLYFSNPYGPDTASDQGYIEVTSPSERLLPPVYFEGAIYVRSNSNMFRVDSTPGQANPWAATKLGGVTGLSAPWATSAEGPILAWLGPDGVYGMSGQGQAENLTRDDLYPLFPFESRPGLPISISGYTLYPPDYTQQAALRLSYADGFLYLDYLDTQGSARTLAMNIQTKGWIPYAYAPGVNLHYQQEGIANPLTYALGSDGTVNYLSNTTSDGVLSFACVVVTPADDQGDTRARKQYGDMLLDYSGQPNATVYYDNFLVSSITPMLLDQASRTQQLFDLGLDAVSLHRNIGLTISWTSSNPTSLYEWQPSFIPKPEDTIDRPTDWMDAGSLGYKFVHGCRITADTGGVARSVQIQYDGGILGPVLTVQHNGEMTLPYSFLPFKCHLMRLLPADSYSWRLMTVEWDVDPEPEPTGYWYLQPSSFGLPGYLHMRDMQFAYASMGGGGILTMVVDGTAYTITDSLISTQGAEVKKYLPAPPIKGKIWQLYATGTALQVYQNDCEFRIKPWGGQQYAAIKPIGDATGGTARI